MGLLLLVNETLDQPVVVIGNRRWLKVLADLKQIEDGNFLIVGNRKLKKTKLEVIQNNTDLLEIIINV